MAIKASFLSNSELLEVSLTRRVAKLVVLDGYFYPEFGLVTIYSHQTKVDMFNQINLTIKAIAGQVKNRTMVLKLRDYIELVEWTVFCVLQKLHTSHPCE